MNKVLVVPLRVLTGHKPFSEGSLIQKFNIFELISVRNEETTSKREYCIDGFEINQLFVEIKVVLSEPTISNNITNDSD